jgi:hypothetical protein
MLVWHDFESFLSDCLLGLDVKMIKKNHCGVLCFWFVLMGSEVDMT